MMSLTDVIAAMAFEATRVNRYDPTARAEPPPRRRRWRPFAGWWKA